MVEWLLSGCFGLKCDEEGGGGCHARERREQLSIRRILAAVGRRKEQGNGGNGGNVRRL
jgi:hypothetical protein